VSAFEISETADGAVRVKSFRNALPYNRDAKADRSFRRRQHRDTGGKEVRLYSTYLEGLPRKSGEPLEGLVARQVCDIYASDTKVEPPPIRRPLSHHPLSETITSGKPHICTDLETR